MPPWLIPLCGGCISVLTVLRAFPCRTRLADRDSASAVEEEVTQSEPRVWSNSTHHKFFPCSKVLSRRWNMILEKQSFSHWPCFRSVRTCSCAACPWWAGTTVTREVRLCHRCRTSTPRWTISWDYRAQTMASSPAWASSVVSRCLCTHTYMTRHLITFSKLNLPEITQQVSADVCSTVPGAQGNITCILFCKVHITTAIKALLPQ